MSGRWPANVILSLCMAEVLDGQSGYQRDGVAVNRNKAAGVHSGNTIYGARTKDATPDATYGSGGGASRFFLTAGYEPWEYDWIIANGLTPCGGREDQRNAA